MQGAAYPEWAGAGEREAPAHKWNGVFNYPAG